MTQPGEEPRAAAPGTEQASDPLMAAIADAMELQALEFQAGDVLDAEDVELVEQHFKALRAVNKASGRRRYGRVGAQHLRIIALESALRAQLARIERTGGYATAADQATYFAARELVGR